MDQLPQNRELIRWLRDYNSNVSPERQVNFYGFDIPGSPGNVGVSRGMDTALRAALEYLDRMDPVAGAAFHARLDALIRFIRFDLNSAGYDKLSVQERDRLTGAIADLVSLFQRCEARYSASSSDTDYQWAMRAAIGARDVDAWLRCIPADWQPLSEPFGGFPNEQIRFLSAAHDVRDRAQADCLEWIIEREAGRGKLLLFAHRYHLSCATVDANGWFSRQAGTIQQEPAGTYLKRRHGRKVVSVGNFIAAGSVHCADFQATLTRAGPESLDGFFAGLGSQAFLLDLREAPDSKCQWLDQPQVLGQDPIRLRLRSAYDLVLFFERVTPAGS
jgi:erythromycin esterase-like protein